MNTFLGGLGQTGAGVTKILQKADATSGVWTTPTSSEGNGAVLNGCFFEFKNTQSVASHFRCLLFIVLVLPCAYNSLCLVIDLNVSNGATLGYFSLTILRKIITRIKKYPFR